MDEAEHLFPTGLIRTGGSVLMSKVKELGIQKVVEDSSGNAGCAVAAYGPKGGSRRRSLSPEYLPREISPDPILWGPVEQNSGLPGRYGKGCS